MIGKAKRNRLSLTSLESSACRALYMGAVEHPRIEFTFKHAEGEVILTMPLEQATVLIQQALHALDAATPKMPKL